MNASRVHVGHPQFVRILFLLVFAGVFGCGGSTDMKPVDEDPIVIPPDAGSLTVEPAVPGTCDTPETVVGIIGSIEVNFDSTDWPTGPMDLGDCGNPGLITRSPQHVVAYTVPGTGPHAVNFTTAEGDTLTNFDTVIQVRTSCNEIPDDGFPPTCFDQISATDSRSAGTVMATGGDVLYAIVTGYAETPLVDGLDRGPATLTITARTNAPPVLVSGDVRLIGSRTEIFATASDPDGDGYGLVATFVNAAGGELDLNGDGITGDALFTLFDQPVTGETDYTGVVTVFAVRVGGGNAFLTDRLAAVGADHALIRVFDDAFAMSEEVTAPIRILEEVGFDQVCDADHACYLGLYCGSGGHCTPTAEIAAVCDSATPVTFEASTTSTVSVTDSGMLAGGHGVMESSCGHTPGAEAVFDVTVPEGAFDLLGSTDVDATAGTDTVIHVRMICSDLSTDIASACNDDIAPEGANIRSGFVMQNVAAGTYSVFVAPFGHPPEAPVPYGIELSLRPVLSSGAPCDLAGALNRCADGACAGDTPTCP